MTLQLFDPDRSVRQATKVPTQNLAETVRRFVSRLHYGQRKWGQRDTGVASVAAIAVSFAVACHTGSTPAAAPGGSQTIDVVDAALGVSPKSGSELALEAERRLRQDRIAFIRGLVDANDVESAIDALERWYPDTWKLDPELAEERARAEDRAAALCSTLPCRLAATEAAFESRSSFARINAKKLARQQLVETIDRREQDRADLLSYIDRLNQLEAIATETTVYFAEDLELALKASEATKWSRARRQEIPLIGATVDVAGALLGRLDDKGPGVSVTDLEGILIFVLFDGNGRCKGLYVVGGAQKRRLIGTNAWPADRIVSQAVGHPVDLRRPAKAGEIASRWREGATLIVARWREEGPVELRIGDAKP